MIDTLNHIEILLVICTAAVVLIAILLAVALYYGIMILRSVRNISRTAEQTTNQIAGDITELRQNIRQRGFSWSLLADLFKNFRRKKSAKSKK